MTEVSVDQAADEIKRLQGCIADLLGVLALPAIWAGQGPSETLGALLDMLLGMLRLDFAYVWLHSAIDESPIEWLRIGERRGRVSQPGDIGRVLGPWLTDPLSTPARLPNPVGDGEVTIAAFRLGLQEEIGILVAGSRRADFPTDIEKMLLRVASNQAAMGLQEARLLADQRRAAVELEQRVMDRTSQLAAMNEELRKEVGERKRAEDALRRSETYLAEGQRLSQTGSWARRLTSDEIFWSDEAFRIVGLDPQTTRPSRQLITRLWHPDDRDRAEQTIEAAAREKRGYEMGVRLVRPDGSIRHAHILGHPVLDQAGEVVEFMGVIMDVTERKRAERALRRARERVLEARFGAALEERTRIAREIHDTLLQGFTGVALKLVAGVNRVSGPPETVAALDEVIRLAQHTLVDARRAVWDLRSPPPASGDFSAAIKAAAEDCVRDTGLTLGHDVGGPPQPVDPVIEVAAIRVVQEAITNVIKHADAGTVRVSVSFEAKGVRLAVIDDGRGFVVERDIRAYGGHWGLVGMRERAICVRGKVSVRSTPGHGTKIILLVPYVLSGASRVRGER
jgi:PAS domain S-box-containing protein